MAEKGRDGKRKKTTVDLTGDSDTEDDNAPPTKVQKNAVNKNTQRKEIQQDRGPFTAYQTPPNSSAPRSSQHTSFNPGRTHSVYTSSQPLADSQHSQTERNSWLADDEDDVDDIISSSTQQAAADTEQLHHYGDLYLQRS